LRGGVSGIYITVGYKGEKIRKAIQDNYRGVAIHYIDNSSWEKGDLTSLYVAKEYLDGDFILSMSEHLFDPTIVNDIIHTSSETTVLLAVDRKYQQVDDDMKVLVEGKFIKNIGKNIVDSYINTGLFKMKRKIFEYSRKVIESGQYRLYLAVLEAAKNRDAKIMDINRRFWIDIDTQSELNSYYVQKFPDFLKNKRWD